MVRLSALGDAILAMPVATSLAQAYPEANIFWVTRPGLEALAEAHPAITACWLWPRHSSIQTLWRLLHAHGVDTIVDLQGKWLLQMGLRLYWPAKRYVCVKPREWSSALTRYFRRPHRPRELICQRYHGAVERLVGGQVAASPLRLWCSAEQLRAATALLSLYGLAQTNYVAIAPGAQWETKRWPLGYFAVVVQHLRYEMKWPVVVLGNAQERGMCEALQDASATVHDESLPPIVNLAGKMTIGVLMGVVAKARLMLANDSGPMHMARALNVPTVALFGSTAPSQFDFTGHVMLAAPLPCSPCSLYGRRQCPLGHMQCLHGISIERCVAAIQRCLALPYPAQPVIG